MIRIARNEDLDSIIGILKETIEDLHNEGNYQWNEDYPLRTHFEADIKNTCLYVAEVNNEVAGFICINTDEDLAYQPLPWRKEGLAIVIHRFAIKRSYQRQKIGTKLIDFVHLIFFEKTSPK